MAKSAPSESWVVTSTTRCCAPGDSPEVTRGHLFHNRFGCLYLERDNESFTRNLVVASADSLDVNTDASDHP
jgi:hypothetical protein